VLNHSDINYVKFGLCIVLSLNCLFRTGKSDEINTSVFNLKKKNLTISENSLNITCVYANFAYNIDFSLSDIDKKAFLKVILEVDDEKEIFRNICRPLTFYLINKFNLDMVTFRRANVDKAFLTAYETLMLSKECVTPAECYNSTLKVNCTLG